MLQTEIQENVCLYCITFGDVFLSVMELHGSCGAQSTEKLFFFHSVRKGSIYSGREDTINVYILACHDQKPLVLELMHVSFFTVMWCK